MKVTNFAKRLTAFLTEYLPAQRGVSPHTIRSYRDSFVLFLGFLRDKCGLAPERVDLDHLRPDVVVRFLRYLAQERGCGTGTCNLRLVAIHSFVKYLQLYEPGRMADIQRILAVPTRRFERGAVSYLSEKDLRTLLAQPDLTKPRERRDAVLLSMLYDTAARAAEILALSAEDVRLESPAQVHLHGKGGKKRAVPLMKATTAALRTYMRETGLDHPDRRDERLFHSDRGKTLTKSGLRYVLAKYAKRAATADPAFRAKLHPHMLRHSKAMHLVESGCPLHYVRDLLGHEDLRTTAIYARTNLELQRAALEKADAGISARRLQSMPPRQDLLLMLRSL